VSALEVIARFMAVLELFREATIQLDQPECFGELIVRWTPHGVTGAPEENAAGDDDRRA
jgi:segregation and condensation protein A